MIIPIAEIAPETLHAILQEFVTREGTDYGLQELSLQQKMEVLMQKVKSGAVVVVYDETSESVNLMDVKAYNASNSLRS